MRACCHLQHLPQGLQSDRRSLGCKSISGFVLEATANFQLGLRARKRISHTGQTANNPMKSVQIFLSVNVSVIFKETTVCVFSVLHCTTTIVQTSLYPWSADSHCCGPQRELKNYGIKRMTNTQSQVITALRGLEIGRQYVFNFAF